MNPIWQEKMTVRSYNVGHTGVIKTQSIFQFFQEVAGNHATHLGVGYDELQKLGLFWVLSRVKIEIRRLPLWGADVTMTTWPKGVDKLFALRDFRMTSPDGEVLVNGTSGWLLVDIQRMRPQRINSVPRPFPINDKEHAIEGLLDKLMVAGNLTPVYERKVMPSDLDVNDHVNNTEYVRWIADCFGIGQRIKTLQVNYLEEARLGDMLAFTAGPAGDDPAVVIVEGMNTARNSRVVQARAELEPLG